MWEEQYISERDNNNNMDLSEVEIHCRYCKLQISDFGRSDRKCHIMSDNCIIILRKFRSEDQEGVLLASAHKHLFEIAKTKSASKNVFLKLKLVNNNFSFYLIV